MLSKFNLPPFNINFALQTNHRARERFELMENDPAQIEAHNKMQVAEELDLTVVEPPDQKEAKVNYN